jgi:hypothetical protein
MFGRFEEKEMNDTLNKGLIKLDDGALIETPGQINAVFQGQPINFVDAIFYRVVFGQVDLASADSELLEYQIRIYIPHASQAGQIFDFSKPGHTMMIGFKPSNNNHVFLSVVSGKLHLESYDGASGLAKGTFTDLKIDGSSQVIVESGSFEFPK